MKKIIRLSINTIIIIFITVSLLEMIFIYSFRNPGVSLLPLDVMRSIYVRELRNTIQFVRECSRYDGELFYTLRPGKCIFDNLEYTTHYNINSVGLRDDEDSLVKPEIIVLGDSHAMGWGVNQEDTFSARLEKLTNKKTLNAGVSSYGSARELTLLESKIDNSNLRYLVLQYSDNDVGENISFYKNGKLDISGEQQWEELAKKESKHGGYFPGRYSVIVGYYLLQWISGNKMFEKEVAHNNDRKKTEDLPPEHELFLNVMRSSKLNLNGIKIIIMEINGYNKNDSEFITAVKNSIDMGGGDYDRGQFLYLDVSKILKDEHYYLLDDHMKPEGHKKIAESLAKIMQ